MSNTPSTYTDFELYMQLSAAHSRESAFKELYRRYEQRVWAYCWVSLHNEDKSKDIIQEAFFRFYKAGEKGVAVDNVPAYLMRIVRNLVIDEHRKSDRQFVDIEDIDIPAPADGYEQREMNAIIETALQLLPAEYKDALIMQTYSDMSYNEIAEVQNVPLTTVRNRIVRAKARMREILSVYINNGE